MLQPNIDSILFSLMLKSPYIQMKKSEITSLIFGTPQSLPHWTVTIVIETLLGLKEGDWIMTESKLPQPVWLLRNDRSRDIYEYVCLQLCGPAMHLFWSSIVWSCCVSRQPSRLRVTGCACDVICSQIEELVWCDLLSTALRDIFGTFSWPNLLNQSCRIWNKWRQM